MRRWESAQHARGWVTQQMELQDWGRLEWW